MDPEEVARQLGARGVLEPDEAELFGRPEPATEYVFDPTPPEELGG